MKTPLMWYTSRTPIVEGQTHCAFSRWLGYHAGPHGTGWHRQENYIPLATGSGVHRGLELLGGWLKDANNESPTPEVIAWAATEAAATYEQQARAKGLVLNLGEASSGLDSLILEQRTLIEGLVWVWAIERLPGLLRDYRVLDVEKEELLILDCTGGLGKVVCNDTLHELRGCQGIVQMGRADWLLESRTSRDVIYVEFKTKATPNMGWERAWEHSGQLLVNMEAASHRLGKPVSAAMIDVLYKGRRWGKDEAPKQQQSSVCYGIYEPGGLGAGSSSWSSWRQRKEREYWSSTVPIWDESYPMAACRIGASRVESWISPRSWPGVVQVLGPFPRPAALVEAALNSIMASERQWRTNVATIRRSVEPDYQATQCIDRSWQCTSFDGSPCQFVPICFDQPEAMRLYQPRVPHHAPEKAAFERAGMTFASETSEAE